MDIIKSKSSLQLWQIAKINVRHNFLLHLALAVVMIILTPVLFGTTNLDVIASAAPLEMLVSLIGIVLLTPIFQPEQSTEIEDITASKYVNSIYVHIIRVAYSLIGIVMLISVFVAFMGVCGCSVTAALLFGTIADAMFLGSFGMVTAAITNNTAVSYMIPLVYYALNYTGGSKLGNFYLFSMMGGSYTPEIWLFGTSVILMILAMLTRVIIKKCR